MLRPSPNNQGGIAVCVCALTLASCAGEASTAAAKHPLHVLAASSLTEAFVELERSFEALHPETDVVLGFGGSQSLRLQVEQGAPADVLATANPEHLEALARTALAAPSATLAYNHLVLVVPASNPTALRSLSDLPRAQRVVLGASNVPAGAYADALLERATPTLGASFREDVLAHVVSREANVRIVLAKVELGEADAALVYATDVHAARHVHAIEIPAALDERAEYRIARILRTADAARADAFIAYALSAEGRATLARHGFDTGAR